MTLRVVGAGLGRTGTHSLKIALEQLLGAPCYHMFEVIGHPESIPAWQAAVDGQPVDWDAIMEGYEAAVDWPVSAFWRELAAANPDAVVLLSTRSSADAWWKSANDTIFEISRREAPPDPVMRAQMHMAQAMLSKRFTPGQMEWIIGRGRHITIFPNLLLNDLASTHLRTYRPLAVDRMETMIWCIAPAGEPREMRAARLRKFEDFFLPSGMATPDDVAVAESAHKASFAFDSKWTNMGRGIDFKIDGPDAAAAELGFTPRASSNSWDHEIAMQGVYRRWREMMERGEERDCV